MPTPTEPSIPIVIDLEDDSKERIASLEVDNETLRAQVLELEKQLKKAPKVKGPDLPSGDYASFGGKIYEITGNYRADNTFIEVKRGHCDEGCTLLSIARPH